jgi:hypothetical protein
LGVFCHARSYQALKAEVAELQAKLDKHTVDLELIPKMYGGMVETWKNAVYRTQPNVDSAISQDDSSIILPVCA